jgi:hypothetical protein
MCSQAGCFRRKPTRGRTLPDAILSAEASRVDRLEAPLRRNCSSETSQRVSLRAII